MATQLQKAETFRELHRRPHAFAIPNPWDAGTARLLAHLGFEALATTSAGYAFSAGLPDGAIGRDRMMMHLLDIVRATELPVSADLGNGFGDAPEVAAATIHLAARTGIVGGSIEDATGSKTDPIYAIEQAVDRIKACAAAARSLHFPFTLTARAENYLVGRPDLADTIRRLQAYQAAGADVLYAPGVRTREDIAAIVSSVDRPVNVVMGLQGLRLSMQDLTTLGVRRVSVGSALARAALGAFVRAANEIKDHGTFEFSEAAVSSGEINRLFT